MGIEDVLFPNTPDSSEMCTQDIADHEASPVWQCGPAPETLDYRQGLHGVKYACAHQNEGKHDDRRVAGDGSSTLRYVPLACGPGEAKSRARSTCTDTLDSRHRAGMDKGWPSAEGRTTAK